MNGNLQNPISNPNTAGTSRWSVRRRINSAISSIVQQCASQSTSSDSPTLFDTDDQLLYLGSNDIKENSTVNNIYSGDHMSLNTIETILESQQPLKDSQNLPQLQKDDISTRWCVSDEGSDLELDNLSTAESFIDKLADWAVTQKISLTSLSSLLHILKEHFPDLLTDPRTLLKTKTEYAIASISGGEYQHFGLANGIKNKLHAHSDLFNLNLLKIQINIDGLPLFKSSSLQFWPILGMIEYERVKDPFIIGLFQGHSKPKNVEEFLGDFIYEAKMLEQAGLSFQGKKFDVHISAVVCDAPARSFVKQTKSHTGYSGCDRCVQEGVYTQHKMTFPEVDSLPRTDESFRAKSDEYHHIGQG